VELGDALERVGDITLYLDQRDRLLGQPAVREAHRVGRILPAFVDQEAIGLRLIFDETIAIEIAVAM
jgi:hypothetical protein